MVSFLAVHHFLYLAFSLWHDGLNWFYSIEITNLLKTSYSATAYCILQYLILFFFFFLFLFFVCLFVFLRISHQWAPVMCWWSQLGILQCPEPLMLSRSCGVPASLQISPMMSLRWAACLISLKCVQLNKCYNFLEWNFEVKQTNKQKTTCIYKWQFYVYEDKYEN